jgi:hypothetical protein
MSFVLIILNCKKYDHKRQRQITTWLQHFPLPYYHVLGDPAIETEYIRNDKEHLLTVKVPDDYMSLPKKTFMAVKAIYDSMPDVKYILKTDDDMNCHLEKLDPILKAIQESKADYGGHIVNCGGDYQSTYHYIQEGVEKTPAVCRKAVYCNGRFYFLSRKSMEAMLSNKDIFWNSAYEDNTVGYVLSNAGGITFMRVPDKILFYEY